MKIKTKIILIIGIFLLMGSIAVIMGVSNNTNSSLGKSCEKRVEFYFDPSCPHCKEVTPLINQLRTEFSQWKFYDYDVTQGSYPNITGVPMIKIYPIDGREIVLSGSYEIPKYLKCELQEKSSSECPTHLNLVRGSYFLAE
jgi:thiol-disulfide isomerase/thioredoxin